MVHDGALTPAAGGGYLVSGEGAAPLLIVPAAEVETLVGGHPVHTLALLPDLEAVSALRRSLQGTIRNPDLGCQRAHCLGLTDLCARVRSAGGLFGLAHAFTPHRGFYGSTGSTVREALGADAAGVLDFVEMGLSADTAMAGLVPELAGVPLIACSDAHSCASIAREATLVRVAAPGFSELAAAIGGSGGRALEGAFGLDPRLGKYHRSACRRCGWIAGDDDGPGPQRRCPRCGARDGEGHGDFTFGVLDRILEIAGRRTPQGAPGSRGQSDPPNEAASSRPSCHPAYHHHVPLGFLPGVGPKTRARLIEACGSELAAMHTAPPETVAAAAGGGVAALILAARRGELSLLPGGGGRFGRVRRANISAPPPE